MEGLTPLNRRDCSRSVFFSNKEAGPFFRIYEFDVQPLCIQKCDVLVFKGLTRLRRGDDPQTGLPKTRQLACHVFALVTDMMKATALLSEGKNRRGFIDRFDQLDIDRFRFAEKYYFYLLPGIGHYLGLLLITESDPPELDPLANVPDGDPDVINVNDLTPPIQ